MKSLNARNKLEECSPISHSSSLKKNVHEGEGVVGRVAF
jgi:hypothetical protein